MATDTITVLSATPSRNGGGIRYPRDAWTITATDPNTSRVFQRFEYHANRVDFDCIQFVSNPTRAGREIAIMAIAIAFGSSGGALRDDHHFTPKAGGRMKKPQQHRDVILSERLRADDLARQRDEGRDFVFRPLRNPAPPQSWKEKPLPMAGRACRVNCRSWLC